MPTENPAKTEFIRLINQYVETNGVTEPFIEAQHLGIPLTDIDYLMCTECEEIMLASQMRVALPMQTDHEGRVRCVCTQCHIDFQNPNRECSGCGVRLRRANNPTNITYTLDGQTHDGEICQTCSNARRFHSSYEKCNNCNRYEVPGSLNVIEEVSICSCCTDANYSMCNYCDEYHKKTHTDSSDLPKPKIVGVELIPIESVIDAEHLTILARV